MNSNSFEQKDNQQRLQMSKNNSYNSQSNIQHSKNIGSKNNESSRRQDPNFALDQSNFKTQRNVSVDRNNSDTNNKPKSIFNEQTNRNLITFNNNVSIMQIKKQNMTEI